MESVADIRPDKSKLVWTIGGGKGGAGRTLMTASLAIMLANEGRDVIAFDGNFEAPGLHTALGLKRPAATLADFNLGAVKNLNDLAIPTPIDNLRLIAGGYSNVADNRYPFKSRIARSLKSLSCDAILLDLGPGAGPGAIDLFLAGDTGIIVTTPELSAIELVYKYIRAIVYRRLKGMDGMNRFTELVDQEFSDSNSGDIISMVDRILGRVAPSDPVTAGRIEKDLFEFDLRLIVNKARDSHDRFLGPSICEIVEKFYGFHMSYSGYIPFDERVTEACAFGKRFVIDYGTSETAACFNLALKELLKGGEAHLTGSQLSLIRS